MPLEFELNAYLERLTPFILPGGGVPYYKGGGPSVEPALLALLAFSSAGIPGNEIRSLLTWVSGLQNPDGSIGLNPAHRNQGTWLTALSAVVFHHLALKDVGDRALGFLISLKSMTVPNDPKLRQDNTIVGWPWVPGTFGWVEPTAWSVIALNLAGLGGHPRAVEGRRFLLDRQIPSGGWNYGNPGLNDRELLPFWDTTGVSLLALHGDTDIGRIRPSLELLEKNQDKVESLSGQAWTMLSLESYGRDTSRLRQRLAALLNSHSEDGLNTAHFATGVLALSGRRVFVP